MLNAKHRCSRYLFQLAVMVLVGCKNEIPEEPVLIEGIVRVNVENVFGNQPLNEQTTYTNSAGNAFTAEVFKYIISNFELIDVNGNSFFPGNYELVNAFNASTCSFDFNKVPNGTYQRMRFVVGLDSTTNHTLTNNADLDASNGMVWSWNTGYIFLKHEGRYLDAGGVEKPLLFHFGTDAAATLVEVPINNLTVKGNIKPVNLQLDVEKLYTAVDTIDFNQWNNQQSLTANDSPWMEALQRNIQNSFQLTLTP